jgi:ribulose-phosphate 3-epimerase
VPIVAPSLLAADFSDLKGAIALAEEGGADWLHLDVMDGQFVPNLTIGPPVIRSLRKLTGLPFDTHLMIEKPDHLLEEFRAAGADLITVHIEACTHLHRTVHRIRELGAKAGVSINPATPVASLWDILPEVDLVLIMAVNPGFGAQSFIVHSLEKIREAAAMIRRIKPDVYLEVDGGIDGTTAPQIVAAGANVLVAGSFVFGSSDPAAAIRALKSTAGGGITPRRSDSASV